MDFEQILSKARTGRTCPDGDISMTVRVSGAPEQAVAVFKVLKGGVAEGRMKARVFLAGSFGCYDLEPIVSISKQGRPTLLYGKVTPAEVSELVDGYLVNGRMMPDRALCSMGEGGFDAIPRASDLPFFNLQNRIALRNCGLTDPGDIDHYLGCAQGYSGLSKAVQMDPADVIGALQASGLIGSDGCRIADKLQALYDAGDDEKYVVCNGVDSDPRSRTARLLLEGDPHAVLEGLLIAAYAVGARRCIIAADSRWAEGIRTTHKALEGMRPYGLAGDNILDSVFSCEVEIRQTAPSLVTGEETALLRFLEGREAMAAFRPPFPEVLRFLGKPGLVDTIETFAKASAIFQNAPACFAGLTADGSRETRIITLSGDVKHPYTVEVPLFTTIRTLVEDIGGGVAVGGHIKAVQLGGPAGSFLGPDALDLPIESASIVQTGSAMGSTTIEVFDTEHCAVEMTEERMAYLQTQSCGKCVFCREGTLQMSDILRSLVGEGGTPQDLDLLCELGEAMRTGCICAIGWTAANPVLSSIGLFREEYEGHIKEKKCKSGPPRSFE